MSTRSTAILSAQASNDVVCLFLAGRDRRKEAFMRLRSVLEDELR